MTLSYWKNYEVPDFEGIVRASGEACAILDGRLSPIEHPKCEGYLNVSVMASRELFGGQYRVRCGEASAHGSIGVVVLERMVSGDAVWSFVSYASNPFDQIEVKGGYVLILSTSGAVFRFRSGKELEDVTLYIP